MPLDPSLDYCLTPKAERERLTALAIAQEMARVDINILKTTPKPVAQDAPFIVDIQTADAPTQITDEVSHLESSLKDILNDIETEQLVSQLECAQSIPSQPSSSDEQTFKMRIVERKSHPPMEMTNARDAQQDPVVDLNVIHILGPSSPSTPVFSYDSLVGNIEWIKQQNPEVGVKFIAQLHSNVQNTKEAMNSGVKKSSGEWIEYLLKN